jgi:hypothetical protein
MFLVGSVACVVESIGPLNITTLGRRGPDLGTVRAARLARPSRRRRLEPPSPTATVQQVPRPIPPLPEHRSALQRTLGVSTSSSPRSLTLWFVHRFRRPANRSAASQVSGDPPSDAGSSRPARYPLIGVQIIRNTHPVDVASPLWSSSLTSRRRAAQRSNPTLPPFPPRQNMAVHIAALAV